MIERLAEACGVRYSVVLHDYVAVCPQINLINDSGKYCGEEGNTQCHRCLSVMKDQPRAIHADIADPGRLNIVAWRKMYGRLLDHAEGVSAPSVDTKERVLHYFADLDIDVVPHTEDLSHIPNLAVSPAPGQNVRVGIIGAIGPHKGSRVLLECARDAMQRDLPLEFVVIGYTDIDRELEQAKVTITGRYNEAQISEILAAQRIHIAFLPSVWPETYCYTLSVALAGKIPTCVFDLGAQAERLAHVPHSRLLQIKRADDPGYLNDEILKFAESLAEI
jgi:glycosyltransferase involved in cell wall biosynthesis